MSRIGKKPIVIPKDVEVKVDGRRLTVKGPKGVLSHVIPEKIEWQLTDGVLSFTCEGTGKHSRALYGTTRSIVASQIIGVVQGFMKEMELHGQGYKATLKGDKVELHVGFSHPVIVPFDKEKVSFEIKQISNKLATIKVSGIDKMMVGHYADQVRRVKPPGSYRAKGGQDENKGIRYKGERIRTKAGKSSAKE